MGFLDRLERIARHRRYRTGTGFAWWRWVDISIHGELYLRRLIVVQVPRVGSLMVHWIVRPDPQREPHDHPVAFRAMIVRGGYTEERWILPGCANASCCRALAVFPDDFEVERRHYGPGNVNRMRAADIHRIVAARPDTVTLVFAGPKVRDWGFHVPRDGWVKWSDYYDLGEAA